MKRQMSWALLVAEAWEHVSDRLVCFPGSPSSSYYSIACTKAFSPLPGR